MKPLTHCTVATALALVCAACGSASESQAQRDQKAEEYAKSFGADVSVKTNADGSRSVAVNQGGGGVVAQGGSNLEAPAGFPADVPLYPQMNIFSAGALPTGHFMLQGQAADAPDRVEEFYTAQMTAKGWTNTTAGAQSPVMRALQFQKGERTASVNLLPNGSGTTVQIMTPGE